MNNEKVSKRELQNNTKSIIDKVLPFVNNIDSFKNVMKSGYNIGVFITRSDVYYYLNYIDNSTKLRGSKLGRGYDLGSIYDQYGYGYNQVINENGDLRTYITYIPKYPPMVIPVR